VNRAFTFNEMRSLAEPSAVAAGVPLSLLLAIAMRESEWKPWARRGEPHLSDASHGLMQLLLSTARGAGYSGDAGAWDDTLGRGTGLYDPVVNLRFAARHLRSMLDRSNGDVERAVSAYNAGWGNAKKAVALTQFCEVWKPTAPATGRSIAQHCARARTVQPGEWMNQPYVSGVMRLAREYSDRLSSSSAGGASEGGVVPVGSAGESKPAPAPSADSGAAFVVNPVAAIIVAALGVVAWLLRGRG